MVEEGRFRVSYFVKVRLKLAFREYQKPAVFLRQAKNKCHLQPFAKTINSLLSSFVYKVGIRML